MGKISTADIELINIQIGSLLRLARLRKGLSQLDLALLINSNPTMIGRIERFKGKTSWEKILVICKELDFNFCELFELRSKESLLSVVEETLQYEDKLTKEKMKFYDSLKREIEEKFKLVGKGH
ncbi:hypothetical protein HME9304_00626 [Flagellimonas maritima]|uniref:HTH cro/C1-type domain-containing protein n=1 Tax=Flagellimonas maritima TaxID=1383885 RepID=A0A2Z4LP38_9FLAO|nr:helix-turn-helix transcriptional regulator [Allomuricauda aurantiaca]AWX43635.1 hypothetical protein HME9304_00626 [Allomuricauda aurantiaca]